MYLFHQSIFLIVDLFQVFQILVFQFQMILNLVVPVGSIRFVIFDDRPDSLSRGEFFELTVNKENYCRLTVPSGVWFAFEGEGMELNLLLNIANIEHDPNEVQNMELNEIDYDW